MKSIDTSRLFLRSWMTILVVCFASSPQPAWAQAGPTEAQSNLSEGQNPPPAEEPGVSESTDGAGARTPSELSPEVAKKEGKVIILARVVLPDYPVRPRTALVSLHTPVEINRRIQLSPKTFTFSIEDNQRVRKEHFLKLFRANFEERKPPHRSALFNGHPVRFDEVRSGTVLPSQPE